MFQHTDSTTVDAMNLRARRVFAETLILVKETELLEAAGRDDDADRIHSPLSMVAELISTHLGEDIPDGDPHKSDLQHIRHMLWHVDDDGLGQVRSFLSARVEHDLPLESRRPMPSAMPEPEIRKALGLGETIDELRLIWDNLDADDRAALLGRARVLYEGKPKVTEHRRAESNLSNPPDIADAIRLTPELGAEVDGREVPLTVDADVHASGAIDVIVRIGTPRVGKA